MNRNSMSKESFVGERNKWMRNHSVQRISVHDALFDVLIVAVVFENLTVCGVGGVKHFVKTFPDAFVDFFNLYGTVRSFMGQKFGTETEILHDFNGIVKPGEVYFIQISANPRCCLCWDNQIAAAQHVLEPSPTNAPVTLASTATSPTAASTPPPSQNTSAAKQSTIKKMTCTTPHSRSAKSSPLPSTPKLPDVVSKGCQFLNSRKTSSPHSSKCSIWNIRG